MTRLFQTKIMIFPITSFKLIILVVVCVARYVSGDEDVTSVPSPAVNPNVGNGPEGGNVDEGVTEEVNAPALDGNPEEGALEGSAAGADVEEPVAEDAPKTGPVPEGSPVSTPSTQEVTADNDSSEPPPTKPPSWTDRLFAAKYMLTLGVVYIAVCLVMAMKAGPLVVS